MYLRMGSSGSRRERKVNTRKGRKDWFQNVILLITCY